VSRIELSKITRSQYVLVHGQGTRRAGVGLNSSGCRDVAATGYAFGGRSLLRISA